MLRCAHALQFVALVLLLTQHCTIHAQPAEAAATDVLASLAGVGSSCPLSAADFAAVDYATVKKACDASVLKGETFCKSCICAVGTALVAGWEKAGVRVNGQTTTDLISGGGQAANDAANALLNGCSTLMGMQLLGSNALTSDAMTALATCNLSTPASGQFDANSLQCEGLVPTALAARANATQGPLGESGYYFKNSGGAVVAGRQVVLAVALALAGLMLMA